MNCRKLLRLLLMLLLSIRLTGIEAKPEKDKGIQFFQGNWSDAVEDASESSKFIFAHFYKNECEPCVDMKSKVFSDKRVGAYFNEHFLSIALQEQTRGATHDSLAEESTPYPTLAFYDQEGNLILKYKGSMDVRSLLRLGQGIIEYAENEKRYQVDHLDIGAFDACLEVMRLADPEKAHEMALERLAGLPQTELTHEYNWDLIREFVQDASSREFKYLAARSRTFKSLFGDEFMLYVKRILADTFERAVEEKDDNLFDVYQNSYMSIYQPLGRLEKDEDFERERMDIKYFKLTQNWEPYMNALNTWLETYYPTNWKVRMEKAHEATHYVEKTEHKEMALKWAKQAVKKANNLSNNLSYAEILYQNEKIRRSQFHLKKARKMTRDEEKLAQIDEMLHRDEN